MTRQLLSTNQFKPLIVVEPEAAVQQDLPVYALDAHHADALDPAFPASNSCSRDRVTDSVTDYEVASGFHHGVSHGTDSPIRALGALPVGGETDE